MRKDAQFIPQRGVNMATLSPAIEPDDVTPEILALRVTMRAAYEAIKDTSLRTQYLDRWATDLGLTRSGVIKFMNRRQQRYVGE